MQTEWMNVTLRLCFWHKRNALSTDASRNMLNQVRTMFWHNRWSRAVPHVSNRMKRPNLQKRDKTYSVLGCVGVWVFGCVGVWDCGRRNFITLSPSYKQSLKNHGNLFLLQSWSWDGSFRHGEMKIWLCLYFQHVTRYIGTDFVEESRQKCKDQQRSIFFAKGALIGKSVFQIQRINAVCGRCSSSGVLGDIPPSFTRSVRRRILT